MNFEYIEKIAKRKIDIAFKNKKLTNKDREEYLSIFINEIIENLEFSKYTIRKALTYEKIS